MTLWHSQANLDGGEKWCGEDLAMLLIERTLGQVIQLGDTTLHILAVDGNEVVLALFDAADDRPAEDGAAPDHGSSLS